VRAHADEVPLAFREMSMNRLIVAQSVYTLAKSRFGEIATCFDAVLLIGLLFSVCCRGRSENSQQLSARLFWQWPVFFSLQALH